MFIFVEAKKKYLKMEVDSGEEADGKSNLE
jgi:hypothetical protein